MSSHDSKIDRLLETTISYRDVPVMKDLLVIQKKIRSVLEDWLVYCRSSLGVLNPNMYIFPDFPVKHKSTRLTEDHKDFNKIVLHKRKSKSVMDMATSTPLSMNTATLNLHSHRDVKQGPNFTSSSFNLNEYNVTYNPIIDMQRSKSAYISELLFHFIIFIFLNISIFKHIYYYFSMNSIKLFVKLTTKKKVFIQFIIRKII
jgi:hypothetical protein